MVKKLIQLDLWEVKTKSEATIRRRSYDFRAMLRVKKNIELRYLFWLLKIDYIVIFYFKKQIHF